MSNLPGSTGVEVPRSSAARWAAAELVAPVTTTTTVEVLQRILVTALHHKIIGDDVHSVAHDAAGAYQPLTGTFVDEWCRHHWALPGPRPTLGECDEIAEGTRTVLIRRQRAAEAALPPSERAIAEDERRRAAEARRAELEAAAAAGAAAAAELAALDAGPAPDIEQAPAVEPEAVRRGFFGRTT